MRIARQIGQTRGKVDGPYIRHFKLKGVRAVRAGETDHAFPVLSGFEHHGRYLDLRAEHGADLDIGFVYGFFAATGSRDLHMPDSGGIFHADAELRQLVAGRFKVQRTGSLADDCHVARAGDRDLHVAHPFFSSEDGGGNGHLLSYADDARERAEQHNGLAHEYAFLHVAVGFTVAGNDHDAYTAVVVRHLTGVLPFFPFFQQEGAGKLYDGLEAVHDCLRAFIQGVVAADAEQLLDSAAIGADHIVIQIPGIDTQCLAGVERLPGIGCAEAGKIEQALIDNRQRIGHLAAVLL